MAQIRSPRGALGALALLLALPITIAYSMFFPVGAEVVIHFALAFGTFFIGLSVFDFETPPWLNALTCVAASVLALIFLAQGVAELTQNETLRSVAFSLEIGGWGESITIALVMVWLMAVALMQGRGPTMILGVLSSALVVCLLVVSFVVTPQTGLPQVMRLFFLLPIAWFLFVSTREKHAARPAA